MADSDTPKTYFAPAKRLSQADLASELDRLNSNSLLQNLIEAIAVPIVLLNRERQIMSANPRFADLCGVADPSEILSSRLGEAIKCIHSETEAGGCGTSKFCVTCGAAQAMLTSQTSEEDCEECQITRLGPDGEEALDLRVWAKEISIEDQTYTLFSLREISHEKRRQVLEHMFFHDISNALGGLTGLADLLTESELNPEAEDLASYISKTLVQIHREIDAYAMLALAEKGELIVHPNDISIVDLLSAISKEFEGQDLAKEKQILIAPDSTKISCFSDLVLLSRIIVNLLKNALEASSSGDTVTLRCAASENDAVISVHNQRAMPEEVQCQIFNRSFSTKGTGRGVGTFGAKLLTERYLKGKITFTSAEEAGTTFEICIPSLPQAEGTA